MAFNNQQYSDDFYRMLYELGVYAQPDGSFGISDRLPRGHIEEQYIVPQESIDTCIVFLKSELDSISNNFVSIMDSFKYELEKIEEEKPNHEPAIRDDLVFSFLNSILNVAEKYKELSDVVEEIQKAKMKIFYMKDQERERFGLYSIMLQSMNSEMLGENQRLLMLQHIQKNTNESQIKNMLRYAQMSYGMEEGIGPRGRNNPLTPFGGYDYWYDRVMDGTELHDHSGGHATEKFLGPNGANKFKRHPELLRATKLRLRSKPLRYLSREKRRKLKAKQRLNKNMVSATGRVYEELATDPTYYTWWDERKNPYTWEDRGDSGGYPTWDSYR